jgi:hypothetical protein
VAGSGASGEQSQRCKDADHTPAQNDRAKSTLGCGHPPDRPWNEDSRCTQPPVQLAENLNNDNGSSTERHGGRHS